MLESLKLIIAQWLAPDTFRRAEKYSRIIGKLHYERHWIAVEFPQVLDTMDRVVQQDYNYWRSLDEKSIGDIPDDISNFREYLRRTYKVAE